ncbi:MAG: tetratricopeptide repeat protein [Nitrospinaceae bacterium]
MKFSLKKIFLPVFWTAVVVTGLWALMNYSTPAGNLEPYTKFKKAAVVPEPEAPKPPPLDIDRISAERERANPELAQALPDITPPKMNLPKETLEHISAGMSLAEKEKFNQADTEFEKAAEISPDSPEVFAIWGTSLRMNKKFKGANKRFARAMELAPDDEEIAFNWGISRMEEKNSDAAIELFKKTVKLNPANYLAYNYLGKSYGQKKMYPKEEAAYRKVVELQPDYGWGHFNLGIVLSLQKKFEDAVPHFEQAIEIHKSFEKPFVVQFLTAMGRSPIPSAQMKPKKKTEKPEPVETAKVDTSEPPKEEKKSEGSDHDMEGSKSSKPTTNLKGKFLINGEPPGPHAVIILETKSKMQVPNQKVQTLTIEQGGLQFVPKHSVIQVGSTVTFANNDIEVHNIYSKSQKNQFNLGAMASGASREMKFTQAGPVVLRCNLHKTMIGTIFVVPNGYYTQPDQEGNYAFKDVSSKDYILQTWAPHLPPSDVNDNIKSADLKGVDQTIDFDIKSTAQPGQIHDMVDPTDYNAIVDNIEREMFQAITDWKAGKKFIPRKRMLMAITKHYHGEGLKGALAKSFSEKRSQNLEDKLDAVRKQISGIGTKGKVITEASLKSQATFIVQQLRNTVRELEARLNPDPLPAK